MRFVGLCCLYASLSAGALTQPDTEMGWLVVQGITEDGESFATPPSIAMVAMDGDLQRPVKSDYAVTPERTSVMAALAPGAYEVRLAIPTWSLSHPPFMVRIAPGANTYTWRLPHRTPIQGALVQDSRPAVPIAALAFLWAEGQKTATPMSVQCAKDRFTLPPLFPGLSRITVLTDLGWADLRVEIAADARTPLDVPLTLLPGEPFGGRVIEATNDTPLAGVPVAVALYRAEGTIAFSLRSDANGAFGPLHLPRVPVSWTAEAPGHATAHANSGGKAKCIRMTKNP